MTGFKPLTTLTIFIVAILLDGLILPAFFGLRESILSVLLLVVFILYIGFTQRDIILGLFFSIFLESFRGLNFGDLAIPFLFTVAIMFLVQRFLDIKYTYDARFNLGKSIMLALISAVFFYIFLFFYWQGDINITYFVRAVGLTVVLEALVLVFVFNVVFNKRSDYI